MRKFKRLQELDIEKTFSFGFCVFAVKDSDDDVWRITSHIFPKNTRTTNVRKGVRYVLLDQDFNGEVVKIGDIFYEYGKVLFPICQVSDDIEAFDIKEYLCLDDFMNERGLSLELVENGR